MLPHAHFFDEVSRHHVSHGNGMNSVNEWNTNLCPMSERSPTAASSSFNRQRVGMIGGVVVLVLVLAVGSSVGILVDNRDTATASRTNADTSILSTSPVPGPTVTIPPTTSTKEPTSSSPTKAPTALDFKCNVQVVL